MRSCRSLATFLPRAASGRPRRGVHAAAEPRPAHVTPAARLQLSDPHFAALSRGDVDTLTLDALADVLEAGFEATSGVFDEEVCVPLMLSRVASRVTDLLRTGAAYDSPATLLRVVAAFADAKADVPCVFAEISKHLTPALATLGHHELAALATAYSSSMFYCTNLLSALDEVVASPTFLAGCPPDALAGLLHAFATLNHPLDANGVMLGAVAIVQSWEASDDAHTRYVNDVPRLCWSIGTLLQAQGGHDTAAGLVECVAGSLVGSGAVKAMSMPQATQLMLGFSSMLGPECGELQEATAAVFAEGAAQVALGCMEDAAFDDLYCALNALTWVHQRTDLPAHIAAQQTAMCAVGAVLCDRVADDSWQNPSRVTVAARILHDAVRGEAHGALTRRLADVVLEHGAAWLDRLRTPELGVLAQTFAREALHGHARCEEALVRVLQQALREELRGGLDAVTAAAFFDAARCTAKTPCDYTAKLVRQMAPAGEAAAAGADSTAEDPLVVLMSRSLLAPLDEALAALARAREEVDADASRTDELPGVLRRRVPFGFALHAQLPNWPRPTAEDLSRVGPIHVRVQGQTGWFHDFTKKPQTASRALGSMGSLSPIPAAVAAGRVADVYIPHSSLELPRVGGM